MVETARVKKLVAPARLVGTVRIPGDKSISHRALIFNSLAIGVGRICNFSPARDCLSTFRCLKSLGVRIERRSGETTVVVHGCGGSNLAEPANVLNAGNSATTMRLLSGVLVAQPFLSVITGDASLRSRPMGRVIQPLRLMGAEISGRCGDSYAPLVIRGGKKLRGIEYQLPVPSAQVKSAILLAGLFAQGNTVIEQPYPSRDHTERLLEFMGADIRFDHKYVHLVPLSSPLNAVDIKVPGDISSAAYWLVAGAIHPDAKIRVNDCGINPLRTGVVEVLRAMGARIKCENERTECNEPLADLVVESARLRGIELSGEIIPRLIDEIPLIAVAACIAEGTTIIREATELRAKESDRITTTVRELSRLGADIEELSDGMIIRGGIRLRGTDVYSHYDHRLAMALAIAGLVAKGETIIHNANVSEISYPGFWQTLAEVSAF